MGVPTFTVAVLLSCALLLHQATANENTEKTKKMRKRSTEENSLSTLNIPIYSLAQKLRGEKADWIRKQAAENQKLFAEVTKRDYDPNLIEALSAEKRKVAGSSLNLPLMTLQGKLNKQLQHQKAKNDELFRLLGKR
ncbi:uncharacterized protein [Ptychodera flava]|uniref:uncharacterized protein n=1 Tax=Ptychodera flava TaxID=63121 RepID=UPI00396A5E12